MADFDSDQRRLLASVVLQAENEGQFYSTKDAAGAVDYAIRWEKRSRDEAYRHDAKAIRAAAIKAVKESWAPEPELSDALYKKLYAAAKKLTRAQRQQGTKLVQVTHKGQKYGFKTRWTPNLESIARALLENYTDAKLKLPRQDVQLYP